MAEVDVRPATLDDAEDVQRVARESWHAAYDATLGAEAVERIVGEWYDPEDLTESIAREDGRFLVAETDKPDDRNGALDDREGAPDDQDGAADDRDGAADNGSGLIGFAQTVLGEEGEPAWLPRIYVHPDHWGRGLGSEMLARAEARLRKKDAERLRLVVIADNEVGNAFYEKHGYEVVEERDEEVFDVAFEEYVREKEL